MAPSVNEVLVGPSDVDGAVARLVAGPDGSARVETWRGGGWSEGGADVAEVSKAPPASPDLLDRAGVPASERA